VKLFNTQLPDITPAQVLAVITFIVAQLVAYGVLDGTAQQAVLSAAGTIVPAVWALADALLRGKRVQALAVAAPEHLAAAYQAKARK
jgi:hypothetical protein